LILPEWADFGLNVITLPPYGTCIHRVPHGCGKSGIMDDNRCDVTIESVIGRSGGERALWPTALSEGRERVGVAALPPVALGEAVAGLGPGTRIATSRGLRRIESLEPGERVITRDNGFAEVAGIWRQRVSAASVVTIKGGVLRGLCGEILLGRGQGLLWSGKRVSEALGTREGFLAAGDLMSEPDVAVGFVTLFLPVMARQEVIFAEGVALASALPPDGLPARQILSQDQARRVLRG
jgi:hypothetical protein